ncbi:MAG: DUF1573 domain-containing protein [Chitinophagales bacterium]|nr:DUF1573 domain-containing protein [Bacteroidota bacterium]MCB9227109.1 DUF1573 domain-containing protein [Chitinophagales bacterium]
MKKIIFVSALAFSTFLFSCNSDSPATEETSGDATTTAVEETVVNNEPAEIAPAQVAELTTMSVDRMTHDFGNISDQSPVETKFVVTNTGEKPLLISNAQGSCGCTVPEYPKEPILPGESADIKVSFNPSGKSGAQNKTVTLTANTEPATTVMTIKSNITTAN